MLSCSILGGFQCNTYFTVTPEHIELKIYLTDLKRTKFTFKCLKINIVDSTKSSL